MSDDDRTSPVDTVELSIPVRADLVILARLTAATVAARADFGVEEIEDLRLAVEELCLSIVRGGRGGGRLRFAYVRDGDAVEITCALEPEPGGDEGVPPDDPALDGAADELSLRILDALVDEHGRTLVGGRPSAWLRKRRERSST